MICPTYIAELAPEKQRGWLCALFQLGIVAGIFIVFFVNMLIQGVGDAAWNEALGWRWMLGSEALSGVAAPALFILGAGFAMHFRVLGRHFAPLLPVVVLLMGLGVTAAWRQGSTGKILVVGFFALCLASGLSLRLAARHGKDDYRSAAGLARAALTSGKCVWWSADAGAAAYYQLPVTTNSAVAGSALLLINPPEELLPALVPADVVIVSRKDLYDPHSVIAGFVERNHFNQSAVLPAFVVWEKPAAKTNR